MMPADKTEEKILKTLKTDPQTAMELIVEQYTGLIWSVAAQHLRNPEDIKECVNDTFIDFYRSIDKFDPEKGTLPAFLATIARRRAISRYRHDQIRETDALSEDISSESDDFERLDIKIDLEKAMSALKPEDAEIIRMKYYEGMTVKEIADSLNLPYETVKKRHLRSLSKMRLLLLSVLILLLAVLTAACTYIIMKYFGIIPGYGISQNPETPFYVLQEPVSGQAGQVSVSVQSAMLSDDTLTLVAILENMEDTTPPESNIWLPDGTVLTRYSSSYRVASREKSIQEACRIRRVYEDVPLPEKGDSLTLTLLIEDMELPFTLIAVEQEPAENYSYSLTEDGGVLAIPVMEDGHLMIDLYPMSNGEFTVSPALVRDMFEDTGLPAEDITATAEDGTVLTGECQWYSPRDGESFYRWDFGPAQPGEYTLYIPYLYVFSYLPEDFKVSVSETDIGKSFRVPGGEATILSYSDKVPENAPFYVAMEHKESYRYLCLDLRPDREDMVPSGLWPNIKFMTGPEGSETESLSLTSTGTLTEEISEDLQRFMGFIIRLTEDTEGTLYLTGDDAPLESPTVTYRLNRSFTLNITVR